MCHQEIATAESYEADKFLWHHTNEIQIKIGSVDILF